MKVKELLSLFPDNQMVQVIEHDGNPLTGRYIVGFCIDKAKLINREIESVSTTYYHTYYDTIQTLLEVKLKEN